MRSAEERIEEALEYIKSHASPCFIEELNYILSPPPKRHTFGGVVFEETGEVRYPRVGEFVLYHGSIAYYQGGGSLRADRPILRPVEVVGE